MYNKLVRDKIPGMIRQDGRVPVYSVLKGKPGMLMNALLDKLTEESDELEGAVGVGAAQVLDECVDVVEVVKAIAAQFDISFTDIVMASNKKYHERGAFDEGIFLEDIK
jgi:predicted house-cleaning noncanonical NTP pyrophosphatase (MazG superfamily)